MQRHKPEKSQPKHSYHQSYAKIGIILLILLFSAVGIYSSFKPKAVMRVHFIDVGHGDAILIETPNQKNVLIDTGYYDQGSVVVNYLKQQNISTIDALIITHFDEDHAGGLSKIENKVRIAQYYDNGLEEYTFRSKNMVTKDTTLLIDPEIKTDILVPYSKEGYNPEPNDNSLVTMMRYGTVTFLFMGDCTRLCESKVISSIGRSNILKIGHHGADDATSSLLLERTQPDVAVISTGDYERFGHPGENTIGKLEQMKIDIKRTDVDGTIVIESDGKDYWVR